MTATPPHAPRPHHVENVFQRREAEPDGGAIDDAVHRLVERRRRAMRAMIEILMTSSGMAAKNSAFSSAASHGLRESGTYRCRINSTTAATMALNAPRTRAVNTTRGGSGRLSAATMSHSISKAGATAAATMAAERGRG